MVNWLHWQTLLCCIGVEGFADYISKTYVTWTFRYVQLSQPTVRLESTCSWCHHVSHTNCGTYILLSLFFSNFHIVGFCPLFMLWDFVLWDFVSWDFVRRDFVLWDSVPDSYNSAIGLYAVQMRLAFRIEQSISVITSMN